jgi:CHAD domain-containing protein
MACDTAFRVMARRYLADLNQHHEATCTGDPGALHQMRIALTHLRTVILFFSPMVDDAARTQIREELKWLNTQLGGVRDLDVAIERIKSINGKQPRTTTQFRLWSAKRAEGHRLLTRTLRSARFRRLIERLIAWIENGAWSTRHGKQAAKDRAIPIAHYGASKLAQWEKKLLKKCRKLREMNPKERHRLRLLNKKLSYSIESFEDLFVGKGFAKQKAALKHLRKAQRSLGQLNDDVRGRALAAALHGDDVPTPPLLGPKREKRLLKTTAAAYGKLAALNM